MGPKVRFKSAGRCQGMQRHQGNRCIDAAAGKQSSLWDSRVFSQFLGFSGWELFMRYESSQALQAHTDLITVIAIRLFMPAVITGIKFVDFKSLLYIVLNQIITVVITVIVLHCSSTHFNRGESYVRQTKTQRVVAKVMEFFRNMESSRSAFSSPSATPPRTSDQWKPSTKRGIRGLRHMYHHRRYRKYHIRQEISKLRSLIDASALLELRKRQENIETTLT